MTEQTSITCERLKYVMRYNPETGLFSYRERSRGRRVNGPVGQLTRQGYRRVMIDGRRYMAHRLAWLWMTGKFPSAEVDHVNGNGDDNRWVNLREATRSQNRHNTRKAPGKSTPYKGVTLKKGKWFEANIGAGGRNHYLGIFQTAEDAHEAYKAAALRLHGEFANP